MSVTKKENQFQNTNFRFKQLLLFVGFLLSSLIILNGVKFYQTKNIDKFDLTQISIEVIALIFIFITYFGINRFLVQFFGVFNRAQSIIDGKPIEKLDLEGNLIEINHFHQALDNLVQRDFKIIEMAEKIGIKDFSSEIVFHSKEDKLAIALNKMKTSLQEIAIKDEQNNWSSSGQASFADLLRKNYTNSEELCYAALSFVIKYLDANQGFVFTLNDDAPSKLFLEIKAAYAYDRKRFHQKEIEILVNESGNKVAVDLAGQAFLEKAPIYLAKVPDEYVAITSGLGDATASCIYIVPMKVNDEVFGVIELASFKNFTHFEKDFVVKIAEMLGSTISSTKITDRTKRLLEETQKANVEMREKEEELRQNFEELSALQEELSRNQAELMHLKKNLELEVQQQTADLKRQKDELLISEAKAIRKEKQVIAILNGIDNAIFLATEDGKILVANETSSSFFGISLTALLTKEVKEIFLTEKLRMRKAFPAQIKNHQGQIIQVEAIVNKLGIDGVKCNLFNLKMVD